MMTEEEARKKWCPFARVIAGEMRDGFMKPLRDVAPHNRVQEAGSEADDPTWHQTHNCIASECMAWRWVEEFEPYVGNKPSTKGYCGLAGKQ